MKNKLLEIVNHYGIKKQLKYFYTEVYELSEAINSNSLFEPLSIVCARLNGTTTAREQHIAEEIADCYVMLEQFRHFYGITDKEILDNMNFKINRQLERIENESGNGNKSWN